MIDASLGEILVSVEKLQWTIDHGEKALKSERRPTNFLMMYKYNEVRWEPLGVLAACVSWKYISSRSFLSLGPLLTDPTQLSHPQCPLPHNLHPLHGLRPPYQILRTNCLVPLLHHRHRPRRPLGLRSLPQPHPTTRLLACCRKSPHISPRNLPHHVHRLPPRRSRRLHFRRQASNPCSRRTRRQRPRYHS